MLTTNSKPSTTLELQNPQLQGQQQLIYLEPSPVKISTYTIVCNITKQSPVLTTPKPIDSLIPDPSIITNKSN